MKTPSEKHEGRQTQPFDLLFAQLCKYSSMKIGLGKIDAGGMMMRINHTEVSNRMEGLSDQSLEQVAHYFQALAEPNRLRILNLLRQGECNVGDLAQRCGSTPANVSRHLATLAKNGLVARESRGTSVFYHIADPSIFALCDLVCGSIAQRFEQQAAGF